MSLLHQSANWISPEEYLAGEPYSDVRHEYLAGEVYAMSGASVQHTRITDSIQVALSNHLGDQVCEAFSHDVKVNISEGGREWYYYPDVFVVCEPSGLSDYACKTPAVIFEVSSSETEGTDRREKLLAYRTIPTLHTYVLVSQKERELTVYRKSETGLWTTELLPRDGDTLHLPQLKFSLPLEVIYRRTGL